METDLVRDLARRLDYGAADLQEKGQVLKNACSQLSWIWQGPGSAEFIGMFNAWNRMYEAQVQVLEHLAIRVNREVDEWLSVDSNQLNRVVSSPIFRSLPVASGIAIFPLMSVKRVPLPSLSNPNRASSPWMTSSFPRTPHVALPFLNGAQSQAGIAGSLGKDALIQTDLTAGFEGALESWTPKDGLKKDGPKLGVNIKSSIYEGALYDQGEKKAEFIIGDRDQGGLTTHLKAGSYDAGFKAGVDEDGVNAGLYGEVSGAESSGNVVLGSTGFGITAVGAIKAGALEGFIGVKENDLGGSFEASLASLEGGLGLNIAGFNVGVNTGASVGIGLGLTIGDDITVKLGPFKIGLHIGKALSG